MSSGWYFVWILSVRTTFEPFLRVRHTSTWKPGVPFPTEFSHPLTSFTVRCFGCTTSVFGPVFVDTSYWRVP